MRYLRNRWSAARDASVSAGTYTWLKNSTMLIGRIGTIFLDETGELPQLAQIRLLRVLQNKEIERIGGAETISLDIGVIAATN